MMILNSLFQVFVLLAAGHVLKRYGVTNETFLKTADRLVYFIFFPALLFWKIGGAHPATMADARFCLAVICAVTLLFFFSLAAIALLGVGRFQAGAFSQCFYRFNSYIGVAVVLSALGEDGVRYLGLLIGFVIPLLNVFSVWVLIWHRDVALSGMEKWRIAAKSLVSNPLIIGSIAGVLYSKTINFFPVFLDNTLRLGTMAALPLALISIGGALTANTLAGNLKWSFVASFFKLAVLPAAGYGCLRLFGVAGISFQVGMIFFALPTSPAIYVLSSQLSSDTKLASAAITLSTVLSFLSLSLVLTMIG